MWEGVRLTWTSSLMRPKQPGPIRDPAMMYPVITGWPSTANRTPPTAAATMTNTRSAINLHNDRLHVFYQFAEGARK